MSQPASSESYSLHPVLAAALGSLDVTLESELAQYRCRQTVKRLSPAVQEGAMATPTVPQSVPLPSAQPIEQPSPPAAYQPASSSPDSSPLSWPNQAVALETETEGWAESAPAPEDYLASSQALLKNLGSQPPTEVQQQRYLTPMAIVSLGLLLASFPVAYWIIQSSDYSSGDKPTLAPSPTSVVTPDARSSLSPRAAASLSSTPVASSPSSPALNGDNYYYVVAGNANPEALAQLRRVVPEAYVRDFPEGPKIQVGAYDSRQPAEEIVQVLKRQGIAATIRGPR